MHNAARELFISRQRVVCVCTKCVAHSLGRQRTATITEDGASVDEPFSTMFAALTLLTAPTSLSIATASNGLRAFERTSASSCKLCGAARRHGWMERVAASPNPCQVSDFFEAPIHLIPADTNGQEGGRPSAGTGAGRGRPTSNLVRRRGESRSASRRSQEKGRDAPAAAVAATCSAAARERDGAAARLGVRSRFGRARAAKDAAREIPREVSVDAARYGRAAGRRADGGGARVQGRGAQGVWQRAHPDKGGAPRLG